MFERIVVVGAGAIGSLYAAKLASHHHVTIVGRATHVDEVNRNGLRVVGRETFTCRLNAVTTIDPLPPRTLVLLTTKVNDNRSAAECLARAVRDDAVILCVQNGLGGEDIVKRALAGRGVVRRAITQFGAIFREPGVVDYKVQGRTLIEAGPGSDEIAALLTGAGLEGVVSSNIAVEIWRKLLFNCVINPITAMIGSEVGAIANPSLDSLKRLVIDECVAVARADGVVLEGDFIAELAEIYGPSRNIASMRQDLLKGKPTEIDHMNGAVVELGARHGIPCPVNAALVGIIKALENAHCAR